ncbi:hypothetical protein FC81_GL001237 [Liquorilactobacillus capillatus DSM 19910]|uniref:UDP-N-acetylglucosamine kinase n=1 Tax=Liquorilactobacillus capillatus DSM 19910 TaxID=1423731 RepID=A0A0R1M8M4_9LACO|nr:hypothetical protein FC81_GL001237 [Liquorilactobacillus capillatus DSM 19910]
MRGNSGSGKTTTAKSLKEFLSPRVLLLSQDVLRKQMLAEPDHIGNMSIGLFKNIINWGTVNTDYIIIEGILKRSVYQSFLEALKQEYGPKLLNFYFNISFKETVTRNNLKALPFSEQILTQWWQNEDLLGNEDAVFTDDETLEERLTTIEGYLN